MEVENDGFVVREDGSVFSISQAVRMVAVRDELYLLVLVKISGKWEGFTLNMSTTLTKRIFISGTFCRSSAVAANASCVITSPHEAMTTSGSPPLIVTGPVPDSQTLRAVLDSGGHIEELKMLLFI